MKRRDLVIILWSVYCTLLIALCVCMAMEHGERKKDLCGYLIAAIVVIGFTLIFVWRSGG